MFNRRSKRNRRRSSNMTISTGTIKSPRTSTKNIDLSHNDYFLVKGMAKTIKGNDSKSAIDAIADLFGFD